MKICPTCNQTFADETLTYCLEDGSLLSAPYEPGMTQRLSPPRITSPAKTEVLPYSQHATLPARKADNSALKYVLIALLALITGGGVVWWLNSGSRDTNSNESAARNENAANSAATPSGRVSAPPQLVITVTASSERSPEKGVTYRAGNVLDQSLATAWDEGVDGPGVGEWVRCDFDREVNLKRILITPGYFKTPDIWRMNNRLAGATFYFSDGSSRHFTFPDQMAEQRLDVGGVRTRWVRLVINDYYPGSADSEDTPVSNLAFDWE